MKINYTVILIFIAKKTGIKEQNLLYAFCVTS